MNPGVLDLAADVHNQLLKLVAPASPSSIRASSLSRQRNPALFSVCLLALLAFVIFIIPILLSAATATKEWLSKDLTDMLQIVGGAGLGSSFYALHTASSYIKSGTFDPKYNNTYLIRLGLGLLSGLILAYFLKDFLGNIDARSPNSGNLNLAKIGVSALALVGGYSAEAVAQILDRVSDTLVALVSGSDKDKIDAARKKANADADKKAAQVVSDTVKRLQRASSARDPGDAIKDIIGDLLDRS